MIFYIWYIVKKINKRLNQFLLLFHLLCVKRLECCVHNTYNIFVKIFHVEFISFIPTWWNCVLQVHGNNFITAMIWSNFNEYFELRKPRVYLWNLPIILETERENKIFSFFKKISQNKFRRELPIFEVTGYSLMYLLHKFEACQRCINNKVQLWCNKYWSSSITGPNNQGTFCCTTDKSTRILKNNDYKLCHCSLHSAFKTLIWSLTIMSLIYAVTIFRDDWIQNLSPSQRNGDNWPNHFSLLFW